MSEIDLEAIEARANAATPGPWIYASDNGVGVVGTTDEQTIWFYSLPTLLRNCAAGVTEADASFIAHAREDIPALIARIRQLEAALEVAQGHSAEVYKKGFDDGKEAERERCLGIIYEASTRHLTLAPGINAWVRQVCDNIRRGIEEATP